MTDLSPAEAVYFAAAALPLAKRSTYLDRACQGRDDLRRQVERMLAAQQEVGDFLEPVAALDPPRIMSTAAYHGNDEQTGNVIAGKYTLVELIGEGGMGSVWRAKQTEPVKRFAAVKLIKAGMDSKQVLARFDAERQALALMDHPNIAMVLDGGLHVGRPYFVMELVKGVPITDYCDARKLTPRERLELFISVCQAIQHAHQKGVIHRDVKPSNVLVALYDDKPVVKVIDFGVAKATGPALTEQTIDTGFAGVVGTPQYMSPEQATFNNLDVDTRSDVYSLGVLLYELLTGSPPFSRQDLEKRGLLEMLRVVREEEPPRPSTKLSTADALPSLSANRGTEPKKLTGLLRNELDWVVMKALEKDRARRYETANGFAADVLRYLSGEAVQAHPPNASYRLRKFVHRNKGQVVAASVVLMTLLAGVLGTSVGMFRAESRRVEAEQAKASEAERAEGERKAREQAQKRLAQIEKGNEIVTSIFTDLDVRQVKTGSEPLEAVLAKRLVKAATQLEGESIGDSLAVAGLQDRLGRSLVNLGHVQDAVPLFVKAYETLKAGRGADHPATLLSMNNLAEGYRNAGNLDLALPLYEETLTVQKAKLGADHPDTLTTMSNLAAGYYSAGKRDLSLALEEETLRRRKATLGADHRDTLTSMNNLAVSYHAAQRLDKALPLYEETLTLLKARLGADHPDTLSSMANLAEAYVTTGQPSLAVPLLEEALKLQKAKLGANHPSTLASMNNLAEGYRNAGKLALALPLYEETLRISKAELGADHPNTLMIMDNLGQAYGAARKPSLALSLLEEALKLRKTKLGDDHPDTLTSMNNLGLAYRAASQQSLALSLLEEALKLRKAKLGGDHPDTLTSMNNLGLLHYDRGQPSLALPLFQEAATGVEKQRFHHEHANLIILNVTSCYERLGQFRQAESWRRKWLAVVKERSGGDSIAYENAQAALGHNLLQQRKWADAEAILRECLSLREKKQQDSWPVCNTRSQLGGALLGQKKYAEAEPLLLRGYEGLKAREKSIPPPAAARISDALDRLIDFYTATNKPDEVKKWKAERAKYPAKSTSKK